jgi:predicted dehydrogenase
MNDHRRREFLTISGAAAVTTGMAFHIHAVDRRPSRTIKIGQIGTRHAHASKLEVYRRSPDYDVVGIVETDPASRERAAHQTVYQGLPWMTAEQLLNHPGLEAVLVETHVRDLLATAETCIAAGKHIHLDKPAGDSLPHFRRILDAAANRKLFLQMGYMYRYNPAVVLLRDFLQRGWLGEPFEVHAVMSKIVPPASRLELAEFPGGIMFELGCHVLDLVIHVLGKPDRVSSFHRKTNKLPDGLLDNTLAVLEYPRAIATVKSSAVEVEGFERRQLVVCGTEGTFHIQPLDDPSARVALSMTRGEYRSGYQTIKFPQYTRYVDDAADMARIIHGEKSADFSYEHDFNVQSTLLRAF